MPSRELPFIPSSEIASHDTSESCYVTLGSNVYDVTSFLGEHPGGGDLILEYGGKDVEQIMNDEKSHVHSEVAVEVLEGLLCGFKTDESSLKEATPNKPAETSQSACNGVVKPQNGAPLENGVSLVSPRTGMSSAADLSVATDATQDYKAHKFLDLNKPLLMQVWHGGFSRDFYLMQVHRPRHYPGGESAPLFGNFLEPLSKTAWYVVPMVWLPPVAYGSYLAYLGLPSFLQLVLYWFTGLGLWTLVEYGLHRGLFHVDKYLPDNRVGITAHFVLHGIHHYLPMDKLRLVMPPTLFVALAAPFYKLAHTIFYWDWNVATAVFCGGIFGLPSFYKQLKTYHLQHHYQDYENGFGVTSRFWDKVFGTELPPSKSKKVA
ncbi:fatty acid alpha-hydroxylase [Peltigera leucophlebia]|nr:fatty acid alpha-hydroxylase [Peltigera leucophlebia]